MRGPIHLILVEGRSVGDNVDHNKFYDMVEVNGECHCRYGRISDDYQFGQSGKLQTYPLSKWDSIYDQKIRKGYEDQSHLYRSLMVRSKTTNTKSKYAAIENQSVADIVERLQRYAKEIVDSQYSIKAASVTQEMVDDAQRLLNSMVTAVSLRDFNYYLLKLFKTIPRSMKNVDDALLNIDADDERKVIIAKEQDLLDMMIGMLATESANAANSTSKSKSKSKKKTILEANGISIDVASDEDIELVKSKLGSNANRLLNVWKVSNFKQEDAYEKYVTAEKIRKKNCKLLWHGTRSENIWSILKTGLVLRPTNAVITGKMFGYGIYFAPTAQKSLGYTSLSGSYWAKGHANSGFMLLHAVAYGTPYDVYSFNSKYYNFNYKELQKACPGANCLHAHGGSGMLKNDEIIVYKEEQVMPLYLVEISA